MYKKVLIFILFAQSIVLCGATEQPKNRSFVQKQPLSIMASVLFLGTSCWYYTKTAQHLSQKKRSEKQQLQPPKKLPQNKNHSPKKVILRMLKDPLYQFFALCCGFLCCFEQFTAEENPTTIQQPTTHTVPNQKKPQNTSTKPTNHVGQPTPTPTPQPDETFDAEDADELARALALSLEQPQNTSSGKNQTTQQPSQPHPLINTECPFLLDAFQAGDTAVQLSCLHICDAASFDNYQKTTRSTDNDAIQNPIAEKLAAWDSNRYGELITLAGDYQDAIRSENDVHAITLRQELIDRCLPVYSRHRQDILFLDDLNATHDFALHAGTVTIKNDTCPLCQKPFSAVTRGQITNNNGTLQFTPA